jgi:hypothetical protein
MIHNNIVYSDLDSIFNKQKLENFWTKDRWKYLLKYFHSLNEKDKLATDSNGKITKNCWYFYLFLIYDSNVSEIDDLWISCCE